MQRLCVSDGVEGTGMSVGTRSGRCVAHPVVSPRQPSKIVEISRTDYRTVYGRAVERRYPQAGIIRGGHDLTKRGEERLKNEASLERRGVF